MANVTLNVTDAKGQATGTVEAPEALFGVSAEDVQAHIPLIHQVVTAQLAAARQGTHATKTRGMVSGGGKKPWKQKGTGRARQGSIRAPQWYHGGTVFGPQPRDYPIFVDQLNTYDVITSQYVVFTKEAFEAFVAAKTEPKEA